MDSSPPPSEEGRDRPLSFLAAAGWTLLAVLLVVIAVGISESAHPGALYDLVTRTTCGAVAYSLVLFAILRVHEPETSIRQVLALRAPSPLAAILAILVGLSLALPGEWLDSTLASRYPPSKEEVETLERVLSVSTTGKRITIVATLVVLMPVLDELFFRGALFTPLKRTRRLETVVLATAAYETLANFSAREVLSFFAMSLAFAWIRGLTGSVVPGVLARVAFYGVHYVPLAVGRELPKYMTSKTVLASSALVALLALAGIAALSRRDPRTLDARLDDGE